jgi:hypothetical protein
VDGGSHAQQSGTEEEGDAGAFGSQSALTGYAAQLILSALELIARRASAAGGSTAAGPESAPQQAAGSSGKSSKGGKKGKSEAAGGASTEGEGAGVLSAFDLTLVVSVANQAPDAAVRNAALSLMAVLAKAVPEQALQHVLQVRTERAIQSGGGTCVSPKHQGCNSKTRTRCYHLLWSFSAQRFADGALQWPGIAHIDFCAASSISMLTHDAAEDYTLTIAFTVDEKRTHVCCEYTFHQIMRPATLAHPMHHTPHAVLQATTVLSSHIPPGTLCALSIL